MTIRQWVKDFSTDLNQPAFKTLVAGFLSIMTGWFYWLACIVFGRQLQEAIWGLWLGFLAALWSVTFLDYRTKRQTTFGAPTDTTIIAKDQAQTIVNPQTPAPAQ